MRTYEYTESPSIICAVSSFFCSVHMYDHTLLCSRTNTDALVLVRYKKHPKKWGFMLEQTHKILTPQVLCISSSLPCTYVVIETTYPSTLTHRNLSFYKHWCDWHMQTCNTTQLLCHFTQSLFYTHYSSYKVITFV